MTIYEMLSEGDPNLFTIVISVIFWSVFFIVAMHEIIIPKIKELLNGN